MAEYIVQGESLTAIADEVRILSGTTGAMGLSAMATNVEDANSEIDSQVELLAQAVAALEGKASGGVGNNNIVGEWTPLSSLPVTYGYDDDPVTYTTLYLEVPSNVIGYLLGTSNTDNYTIANISHILCRKEASEDFEDVLLDAVSSGLTSLSVVESGDGYKIYKIEISSDFLLDYYFLPIYRVQV